MKKLYSVLMIVIFMTASVAIFSCCEKESKSEQVPIVSAKTIPDMVLYRQGSSLRFTAGVISSKTNKSILWFTYECPKTNSAFNPHAPNVCVPIGTYNYVICEDSSGFVVTVPDVGDITFGIGESYTDLIPRGGVVHKAVINTSPVTFIEPSLDAVHLLLKNIPSVGTVQLK